MNLNAALGYIIIREFPRIFHEGLARRPKGKPIFIKKKSINDKFVIIYGKFVQLHAVDKISWQFVEFTLKYEHKNMENIRFILYTRACGENSRMCVYFYCNCNYCNALHFAISGLHFEKIKSFCDRGFHLLHFYAFTNWLSTNYTGWNPIKRVSSLLSPRFIHLSIDFQ